MGLVDNDEFWALQGELVAAGALLDVVGGDNQVRIVLVDGRAERY